MIKETRRCLFPYKTPSSDEILRAPLVEFNTHTNLDDYRLPCDRLTGKGITYGTGKIVPPDRCLEQRETGLCLRDIGSEEKPNSYPTDKSQSGL